MEETDRSPRARLKEAGRELARVHVELAQREAAAEQLRAWRGAQYYFGAMGAMVCALLLTEAAVLSFFTTQFGWRVDATALGLAVLNGGLTWVLFKLGDRKIQERPFMGETKQRLKRTLDEILPPPPPASSP